jgi:TRAP-type C4-dicarboxylate transport system permease small subunit
MPPVWQRVLGIVSQLLVIVFFALLGWTGLRIMPILAGDTLVSLPWVSMNFVQSVIPVSAALIVVAELTHLVDLLQARERAVAATALADGLH